MDGPIMQNLVQAPAVEYPAAYLCSAALSSPDDAPVSSLITYLVVTIVSIVKHNDCCIFQERKPFDSFICWLQIPCGDIIVIISLFLRDIER